jgi:hypothetical protein
MPKSPKLPLASQEPVGTFPGAWQVVTKDMELVRFELRAREPARFVGFVVCLTGAIIVLTAVVCDGALVAYVFGVPVAALFAIACCNYFCSVVKNAKCELAVRDDAIWWDSPCWNRSMGTIAIGDICKVTILEGPSKLEILMRNGDSRTVPCWAVCKNGDCHKLRDVLVANYPELTVELVEGAG